MHHTALIRLKLCLQCTLGLLLCVSCQRIDHTDNISLKEEAGTTLLIKDTIGIFVCSVVETGDPGFMIDYNRFAAVFDIAVKHANEDILPKHMKLIRKYKNGGPICAPKSVTIQRMLEWAAEGVDCNVYIGPGCNEAVKDAYNVVEFQKKVIFGCPGANIVARSGLPRAAFPNLLRMSYSASGVAKAIITFLDYFNYTHTSIITNSDDMFYAELGESLRTRFRSTRLDLFKRTTFLYLLNDRTNASSCSLNEAVPTMELNEANASSRVIILFANAATVRNIMIDASQKGMTNGEYVFIGVELFPSATWGRFTWELGDQDDETVRSAFRSLILISMVRTYGSYMEDFTDAVRDLAQRKYNYKFEVFDQIDPVTLGFYEAFILYATAVRTLYDANGNFTDADSIVGEIRNRTFVTPLHVTVRMDADGDKIVLYDMKTFDSVRGTHNSFLRMDFINMLFTWLAPLQWVSGTGSLPSDVPKCGFSGRQCRDDSHGTTTLTIAVACIFVIIIIILFALYYILIRTKRSNLNPNWWRFRLDELQFTQDRAKSSFYMASQVITESKRSMKTKATVPLVTISVWTSAVLQGNVVGLKPMPEKTYRPTAEVIKELNVLQQVRHSNLHRLIGLCLDDINWVTYVIADHCQKGCLDDLLEKRSLNMDWSFKFSLINDIAEGMAHLHSCPLQSHGYLTSIVCLVDNRLSVKISEYGIPTFRDLNELRSLQKGDERTNIQALLWRAPEFLRAKMPQRGSQKGDVYSFAIILQQIILRADPYETSTANDEHQTLTGSPLDILFEVKAGTSPPIRPPVPRSSCSIELYSLMESCWSEFPFERPQFVKIKEMVRKVGGLSGRNFVDHLLKRMEKYASDLEEQVAVKTQQFMDEKTRSEQLLSQMLPKAIAQCLIKGESVYPEYFDMVTVYFSDVVGFTTISASGTPMDVIALLNDLYTVFDEVIERHDAYKVETIGDAYMVASGLPLRNGTSHAVEIATVAWELLLAVKTVRVPQKRDQQLRIRSGLHSGSCVAGIVGIKTPRYCLFGDTVNTASRMESTGEPLKIQLTQSTKELLEDISYFTLQLRGQVDVKGKGLMTTYWLLMK